MKRLTEEIVASGLRMAWRLATWPTRRWPSSVKATTDGVVRLPSALGITSAWPPSITAATTELVVPKSMPTAFAIAFAPLDGVGGADRPLHGACKSVAGRRARGVRLLSGVPVLDVISLLARVVPSTRLQDGALACEPLW